MSATFMLCRTNLGLTLILAVSYFENFFFVAAPTAVVIYCFYFVTGFTASDFCLCVNPTVLCDYVTLSLYWIS